jgi:hypothetical protein
VNATLAENKGGFAELYGRLAKEGKNPAQITETLLLVLYLNQSH